MEIKTISASDTARSRHSIWGVGWRLGGGALGVAALRDARSLRLGWRRGPTTYPAIKLNSALDSLTLYRYNNTTMQPLDRNGNIPLVYQLGEAIRDKIVRGAYSRD